jgi:hypothetical protein
LTRWSSNHSRTNSQKKAGTITDSASQIANGKARRRAGPEERREQIGNDRKVHHNRDARGEDMAMVAREYGNPQQEQRNGAATNHRVEDQERRHRVLLLQATSARHHRGGPAKGHCAASC